MKEKKLLLLDGNSLTYRSFFALNVNNFTSHEGIHTNAIYGLKKLLDTILKDLKPSNVLVAFDAGKHTFRNELFKDYKGSRSKMPSELSEQIPYIRQMLDLSGINSYDLKGYEADDIIGTMAKKANNEGYLVSIVTGDRDLTQLANDRSTVFITKKGFSNYECYTPDYIKEKLNLTPKQIIELKALTGDTSDNYPGVKGVGEKTALKLLNKYSNLNELYEQISDMKQSKMKDNLLNDKDKVFLAKKLATIDVNAPITISLPETEFKNKDIPALDQFFTKLDMKTFISNANSKGEGQENKIPNYNILDKTNINSLYKEFTNPLFYIETLDPNYHLAKPMGYVISEKNKIYVGKDFSLLDEIDFSRFSHILTFDGKKTFVLAKRMNLDLPKINYDLMISSYIDDSNHSNQDLSSTIDDYFDSFIFSDDKVYGKGTKKELPDDKTFFDNLAKKSEGYFLSKDVVDTRLKLHQEENLLEQIELPLSMVLADMELVGIRINESKLKEMGEQFDESINKLKEAIFDSVGQEFNLNSPKQLGNILFNVMHLPPSKKTKTGFSTSVEVLEDLKSHSEVVNWILEYRQLTKLKSTYVDGLQKYNFDHNIIHTRFLQTLTATGRLSSVDPNLQNIPVRGFGKIIRKAFTAREKDWLLFSSDYSQIELRVLAHISQDPHMIKAFKEGRDIHQATAEKIFHLPVGSEITSDMRRVAKATNFGIVYGISDYGLAKNIGMTRKEAANFIKVYLEEYPNIKKYTENSIKFAQDNGYVETLFHRRRYLPDINAKNYNLRQFAERTAMNTPIQGSAADIIKIAMVSVQNYLKDHQFKSKMILQVHDELIFEIYPDEEKQMKEIVPKIMDSAINLLVPLKVDSHVGKTWFDVH